MNPKTLSNETRPLVWTISQEVPGTYCMYIDSVLVVNNCPLEEFYQLYRDTKEKMQALS